MYALLYRSRARAGLLAGDVNDIIETAEATNRRLDVTGLLLYGRMEAIPAAPGGFVQWIEGTEDAVESLFTRIEADPRHADIEVLARGTAADLHARGTTPDLLPDGRLFPTWSMGLVRLSGLPATLDGFLRFAAGWAGQTYAEAA